LSTYSVHEQSRRKREIEAGTNNGSEFFLLSEQGARENGKFSLTINDSKHEMPNNKINSL